MTDRDAIATCCHDVATRGYGILPGVVSADERARALALVARWVEKVADVDRSSLPRLATDSPIVWNLHHKDAAFIDLFLREPAIEAVLIEFLNDPWYTGIEAGEPNYILRMMVARSSVDPLPLHIDSFVPYEGPTVISMQAIMVLEGMDAANGASLVVPGSHLSGRYFDPDDDVEAVAVEADPGDVVFWDSRLWHGAGPNTSGRTRWTLTATFTRWWIKQAFRTTERLPEDIYERLSDREKLILGFGSIPYLDEHEGIDMRRGVDALRDHVRDYRETRQP
jgi:ectoine hydroxylase-related dioxygenase (phytanoyl-CoA dioxygenase family)